MKNVFISSLIIVLFLFAYSCSPCSDEGNQNKTEHTKKNDKHNAKEGKLVLNNGKPWETQVEMTQRVNNMMQLLNGFSDYDNVDAYKNLSTDLGKEFDMIFKECTMTGEAHNQLHNFLIPVKDMIESLNSSDVQKCKQGYEDLKAHLSEYGTYFQ